MPELLANRLFEILPASTIEHGVQMMGPLAKQLAFANVVLFYFLPYFIFAFTWHRLRCFFGSAFFGAAALWGANVLVLFPLADKGVFGAQLPQGPFAACFFLFVSHWMFARMLQIQEPRSQALTPAGRRVFFVAVGIGIIAAVKRGYDVWFRPAGRIVKGTGVFPNLTGLSKEITPADEFYTVSKNSVDPVVTAAGWKLDISGLGAKPVSLTMSDLRKMPVLSMFATLSCISNEVGGDWTGNARWTGVPLVSVLKAAGLAKGVRRRSCFMLRTDIRTAFPIDRATHPFCMLAYEMNEAPLTSTHGFPLRLIVPGIYGM